jgi:very-short-patch-repair endonuclease
MRFLTTDIGKELDAVLDSILATLAERAREER